MCMNLPVHLADCEGVGRELFLDLTDLCKEIAVLVHGRHVTKAELCLCAEQTEKSMHRFLTMNFCQEADLQY